MRTTRILSAAAMVFGLGALGLPGVGVAQADGPSLRIDDVSVVEGDAGTTPATLTVSLDQASDQPVTVDWTTIPGTADENDFNATSGDVIFAPGETTRRITTQVVGDTTIEPEEQFTVQLSDATNATIEDPDGTVTIGNDDGGGGGGRGGDPQLTGVRIGDISVPEGDVGTTPATFTIGLDKAGSASVSVRWGTASATADEHDFVAGSGEVVFAPGELSKQVTVGVVGDRFIEAEETFTVGLSNARNATIADHGGTGTITNDDDGDSPGPEPAIRLGDVPQVEGNSGTSPATVTVVLNQASDEPVTVHWATLDGTAAAPGDFAGRSDDLTFAPGDTSKQIDVPIVGDTVAEDDESFTLELTNPSGATIDDPSGTGTILNDDEEVTPPALSVGDVSVREGDAGTTQAVFPVTLSHASEDTVFFEYETNDGTAIAPDDYVGVHAVTHIAEGETSTEVVVGVVGDTVVESDEFFTLELVDSKLTSAGIDDGVGVGVILNDDEGTPPPNQPPVAEDASVQATQGRPESVEIDASDPEGEPLTYTVDNLPEHGQVTGEGPEFSYTAHGDYTGADGFTVEVCDASGACDNAKVTVSVAEYQPPSEPPSDAGELTVDPSKAKRGQDIEVSGSGFAPGEWVFLVLHSDPERLGAVRTDDNGSIATTVTVPTDAALGEHVVAAYGEESALTGKLTVTDDKPVDPQDPTDPADPKDPRDPGSSGNGGSQGAGTPAKNAGDSGGKGLAFTGSPVLPLLGAGLGMVLLGGLWMLAVRRSRRSPTPIEDLPRRSSS